MSQGQSYGTWRHPSLWAPLQTAVCMTTWVMTDGPGASAPSCNTSDSLQLTKPVRCLMWSKVGIFIYIWKRFLCSKRLSFFPWRKLRTSVCTAEVELFQQVRVNNTSVPINSLFFCFHSEATTARYWLTIRTKQLLFIFCEGAHKPSAVRSSLGQWHVYWVFVFWDKHKDMM